MIYFITAIDTGVGKTVATGLLARSLVKRGKSVITAKLVQTGCDGVSEDIICHREIMGIDLLEDDSTGETCGYVFDLPASPHLAARQTGQKIDPLHLQQMAVKLDGRYDIVLMEGAGGIMVPLTEEMLTIDLAADSSWPLIIVTGPRLGSINHTILTIDAALNRGCKIAGIIYNLHAGENAGVEIIADTRDVICSYLKKRSPDTWVADMPNIDTSLDVFEDVPIS